MGKSLVCRVTTRLSPKLRARLTRRLESLGISQGEFLRGLILVDLDRAEYLEVNPPAAPRAAHNRRIPLSL